MSVSPETLRALLKGFEFKKLFAECLGWDRHSARPLVIPTGETSYTLEAVAQKRGMVVYVCASSPDGAIPDPPTRRRIDKEVIKTAYEHLIVFTDSDRTTQVWQWVKRQRGERTVFRQHTYHKDQPGDSLIRKLLAIRFTLDEEEQLTQPDVTGRVRQALDVDRVTKRFYDLFKREHTAFLKFIAGITAEGDREWYASVMLNRLMFVYFLQKQGFLNGDLHYLRNRLNLVRQRRGGDQFHTFYRHFLLRLFHEGLGQPPARRKSDLDSLLGKVPYLNGGIFELHELEQANTGIRIPDEAFERIFNFFDAYQWHLDDRPLARDNEINPDVLGYIFEKYINQKQMGAYYTKEDITGYIARNTILPFLFDTAAKKCPAAFQPNGTVWRLLRDDPDTYLYPAVRHGVDRPLPAGIAAGLGDAGKRGEWNRLAPVGFALPTETWREHVGRRRRCEELRAKLRAGKVHSVNDLITYNLDVVQFVENVLDNCDDPDLLRAFWQALRKVSVLDPACGSGAFLFAALNVLEPLYDACLERMQFFLDELERSGKNHRPEKFADFRDALAQVEKHPSSRYFILKSIVIQNLYGVDIMKEAVEICKLRLFLKLVAQVQRVEQLEPLPDIDFNIRAGNTLVGFATLEEVQNTLKDTLGFGQSDVQRIREEAEVADRAFRRFHEMQTQQGMDAKEFTETKAEVRRRLASLRRELDRYLASEYDVDADDEDAVAAWLESHKPFHWFAEFYGIMSSGGFDVIIGNPPYVEYSKVRRIYTVRGYQTEECGNIYVFVLEKVICLAAPGGRWGLILPLSLLCTDRMALGRKQLAGHSVWAPSFDIRPAPLFEGVSQRLTIVLAARRRATDQPLYTGGYRRWSVEQRPSLISLTQFVPTLVPAQSEPPPVPKIYVNLEIDILAKIEGPSLREANDPKAKPIYVHRICRYFIKALDFIPHFQRASGEIGKSEDYKEFRFRSSDLDAILCLINSSLFYWFWRIHGDGFHCGYGDVYLMPFTPLTNDSYRRQLGNLRSRLMKSVRDNSSIKSIQTKKGTLEYQEFYLGASKPIMDEIDRVLGQHYGFTDEELDFILNFEIKYRLGQDSDNGEEEE